MRELLNIGDPWELLNRVRELELVARAEYLQPWLNLVTLRQEHEQDALLVQGREVFKYRMDTARGALKKTVQAASGEGRTQVSVVTAEAMAEAVYTVGADPEVAYLVYRYDRPDAAPERVDKLTLGRITYYPPGPSLFRVGTVLMPAAAEDYGSARDLYLDIRKFINKYAQLEDTTFRALACCYVLMTWMYDRFDAVPYLRAQGDLGTGKSRLIRTVGSVCYRGTLTGGSVHAAPIFRTIDRYHGTFVVDEGDFGKSDMHEEIITLLNVGYQRGFPVLRAERNLEGDFDVRPYDCYGPKIIATRRRFRDAALESRCLSHTMPLLQDVKEGMPLNLSAEFYTEAQQLRNKLLLWRMRHYPEVKVDPHARIPGVVEPRLNQIVQPLMACIQEPLIAEEIRKMIVTYSESVQAERRAGLEGQTVLALLKRWYRDRQPERFLMKHVTEALKSEHDLSHISAQKVGDVLRRNLGLKVHDSGGYAWVYVTEEDAQRLARRYGITLASEQPART